MQALRADFATRKTCFGKDLSDLLSLLFGIFGDRIGLGLLCSLLRISGTLFGSLYILLHRFLPLPALFRLISTHNTALLCVILILL